MFHHHVICTFVVTLFRLCFCHHFVVAVLVWVSALYRTMTTELCSVDIRCIFWQAFLSSAFAYVFGQTHRVSRARQGTLTLPEHPVPPPFGWIVSIQFIFLYCHVFFPIMISDHFLVLPTLHTKFLFIHIAVNIFNSATK